MSDNIEEPEVRLTLVNKYDLSMINQKPTGVPMTMPTNYEPTKVVEGE